MQTFTRLLILALVCGMSLSATAAEKYALLIGVAKYDHAEMNKPEALQFPEEDAKALGDLLRSGGYDVELLLGKAATQAAIRAKLTALQKKADAEGVVLIGLFGHGVEVDTVDADGNVIKDGCFCPFDTAMREALDFKGKPILAANKKVQIEPDPGTLVKLGDLMRTLKLAKAGNRIVLADCCRTTPNAARGRSSFGANFSVQDLPENTSLLFGCSPNEQAFEHKDWGHGAFTKCLLDTIEELSAEGPVDTAQLASQMKKRVPALVASVSPRDRQTPKPFITDVVDLQLVLPKPVGDLFTNSIGMKLKLIPAGTFMMGSDHAQVSKDEKPVHRVQISKPFYAGIHEVTIGQILAWLNSPGVEFQDEWIDLSDGDCPVRKTGNRFERNSSTEFAVSEDQPMQNISWFGAVAFCEWCSQQDPKYKYRLPTEAEWEYMARAGSTTEFPWGNSLNGSDANVNGNFPFGTETKGPYKQVTTKVGGYSANKWGLFDTVGNVLEWCSDWYDEDFYANSPGSDPSGPGSGSSRVLRGGSWPNIAIHARSSSRGTGTPDLRINTVGFRVVAE